MAQAHGDQPTPVSLDVEAQLAATSPPQADQPESVRFEGVAVTPGAYVAGSGIQIEIIEAHLAAIATRLEDIQIRDLHEDRIRATVGAVREARVDGEAMAFRGEVGLEPHASIVRRFPETVAFSVGFRFACEDLALDDGGTTPLPGDSPSTTWLSWARARIPTPASPGFSTEPGRPPEQGNHRGRGHRSRAEPPERRHSGPRHGRRSLSTIVLDVETKFFATSASSRSRRSRSRVSWTPTGVAPTSSSSSGISTAWSTG